MTPKSPSAFHRGVMKCLHLPSNLYVVGQFVLNNAGKEYGVGHWQKLRLVVNVILNHGRVKAVSSWQQHLLMVEDILRIPRQLEGDVVECGCWNGSCTVNLSLACALTKRTLLVCDSFEGLPPPQPGEASEVLIDPEGSIMRTWQPGEYQSAGGLEGVKQVVARFGALEVCRFVKGYFHETLPQLQTKAIVLIFEDADLPSSVEEIVRHLWPKLQARCKFYCHEPWSVNVVSLFFDRHWWDTRMGTPPPGFYGSGRGIMVGFRYAWIGYAQKRQTSPVSSPTPR